MVGKGTPTPVTNTLAIVVAVAGGRDPKRKIVRTVNIKTV